MYVLFFAGNELLKCHKETKNVGMIGIRWDGRRGEYVWGHTSKSFIVAHLASSNEVVKVSTYVYEKCFQF